MPDDNINAGPELEGASGGRYRLSGVRTKLIASRALRTGTGNRFVEEV